MKELKIELQRKNRTLIFLLIHLVFFGKAQINSFFITEPMSYNASRNEIIKTLRSDKNVTNLFIDSTNIFTYVKYNKVGTDSALLKFNRNNFSSLSIYFSDSCSYYYCKSYLLENFKHSKKTVLI